MRLIDLDQPIIVPIVDETKGGVTYETQMSVAEMFGKFFEGRLPEIIDAKPVTRCRDCVHCYWAANRSPNEQAFVCGRNVIDVDADFFCAYGARRGTT